MEKLDLSIIIISFKTEKLTRECINSVFPFAINLNTLCLVVRSQIFMVFLTR